jgi:hypothetical protein
MKHAIRVSLYLALLPLASCLRADVDVGEETTGGESSTTEEASEASTQEMGVCGDGKVDEGEGCDDGNIEDGVARGWEDLVSPNEDVPANYLQAAILADESGVSVGDAIAWTNTKADGTPQGSEHCMDWNTYYGDLTGFTGRSTDDILGSGWTSVEPVKCNFGARLYCFQVG